MSYPTSISMKYLLILIVELLAFSIAAYLLFTKTKDEVNRRWKVSVLCGVTFGLSIDLIFFVMVVIDWLIKLNFSDFLQNVISFLDKSLPAFLGLEALIVMPGIIIGTLIAYYRFLQSGDRLIEKFWRNPKIHYRDDQKPPYF